VAVVTVLLEQLGVDLELRGKELVEQAGLGLGSLVVRQRKEQRLDQAAHDVGHALRCLVDEGSVVCGLTVVAVLPRHMSGDGRALRQHQPGLLVDGQLAKRRLPYIIPRVSTQAGV
jgi:hypothetical protein